MNSTVSSSSPSKSHSSKNGDMKKYGGVDNIPPAVTTSYPTCTPTKEEIHAHWMSTLALCSSVFSMFFQIFSIFPYGGFMALQLVPSLNPNNVGTYAGVLTGSMKIAGVFTAYPWGIISDTYGRKFVLLFSTASSAVLMLAFGFSSSFTYAVAMRILIGLSNGIMTAARVSATELAKGNHELETKGMGLIMSMVGVGMLFGPAVGGLLSKPVTQYANVDFGPFEDVLLKFPFLLPNLIGSIICTISTLQVAYSVEETLPPERLRSAKYIIPDIMYFMVGIPTMIRNKVLSSCWRRNNDGYEKVQASNADNDVDSVTSKCSSTPTSRSYCHDHDNNNNVVSEDLKIIASFLNDQEGVEVGFVSKSARASFRKALRRRSSRLSEISQNAPVYPVDATIASLMADTKVRECLLCYWIMTFASAACQETLPLFAMAKEGGLGFGVSSIGTIGVVSGLFFVSCQYFIFSLSMKYLRLHKTMLLSGLLAVIPSILIPISLLLLRLNTTVVFVYLGILNGILQVFFSNWNAALSITQNRLVHPQSRARVNGLAAVGTSMARGIGPLFAGVLVTFSYSVTIVPVQYSSLIIFTVVSALGWIAFVINSKLEDDDDDDHNNDYDDDDNDNDNDIED